MTTRFERAEAYAAFRALGRTALRVPVWTRTRVVSIQGRRRVESVVVEDLDSGQRRTIPCDTVVTTGDWIPDHELARLASIDLDPGTLGPVVDAGLRTSAAGVFAIGNLVHPVDTADAAALDGRHVAETVRQALTGTGSSAQARVEVLAGDGFRWVSPQRIEPGAAPSRDQLLLWPDRLARLPRVRVVQDGAVLAERRIPWPASPGRVFRVPASLLAGVSPTGGPVTVSLAG